MGESTFSRGSLASITSRFQKHRSSSKYKIRNQQQKTQNDILRKNAGIKGDEIKNMLDMQKNLETNKPEQTGNAYVFNNRRKAILKSKDSKAIEGKSYSLIP
jgi:hypothetical protein